MGNPTLYEPRKVTWSKACIAGMVEGPITSIRTSAMAIPVAKGRTIGGVVGNANTAIVTGTFSMSQIKIEAVLAIFV